MRFGKPTPAMVVAVVAFIAATAGTALAATGQLVNIADPTNAARLAKVDAGGRLNVGDGSGPLTVDGIVNQRETPPTTPMYFSTGINIGDGFIKIATSPANKALVIKSLFLNTYSNPSPGQAQNVQFYIGPTSSGPLAPIVAEINPPGLGLDSANVESGIIVPATSSLYADGNGSVQGLVYGFGYIVASSSGPAMTYVTPPS